MNESSIYLHLGFKHIIDLQGVDHILFVLALTIRYGWSDWKKLVVLITAFTIGHSITLALSTLDWLSFPVEWIELLIPMTIFLTGLVNFWVKDFQYQRPYPLIYFLALFFGLIHGLGFSNYLKSLLGQETTILTPLFSFNVGLELGQLLIVSLFLIISIIFVDIFKVDRRRYVFIGSGLAMAFSLNMMIERFLPLI